MEQWAANLDAILNTSLGGVVICDLEGRVRGWNHHAADIFGWSAEEVLGQRIDRLVVADRCAARLQAEVDHIVKGADARAVGRRIELVGARKDGRSFPLELGLTVSERKGHRLLLGFVRDLTEQRRAHAEIEAHITALEEAQEALRASEELYRHVVELSSLIPWTADRDGRILAVGKRWSEWTGAPNESALDEDWLRFVHPDDIDRIAEEWRTSIETGRRYETEWRIRKRDGSYCWCHARATRRVDGTDDGVTWYGTLEDIHERHEASDAYRRAQAELARVSRLSAMGAMATAIAHDLNQPLTAIVHYVRGSRRLLDRVKGEGRQELAEALEDADKSAVRASDIVRRVRDFVTRGTIDARREDLAALVDDACRFAMADGIASGVVWRTMLDVSCPVYADRIQIQQVLVNLLRNAIEAMRGQPRRVLTVRATDGKPGFCEVAICDTGPGIPKEAASRIFDPLYTTRKEGMGVGLAISRTIVEAHGGAIWHEPAPGGGTAIKFTLPTASDNSHEQAPGQV